jgi:hypothetical protein
VTFAFDHAIIYVEQLERAMTDFGALGFSIVRGGEHTEMGTHNALIILQDGRYIELLAAMPGRTPQGFPGRLVEEGFAGFCLRSKSMADDLRPAVERGVNVSPLRAGSRTRTDGQRIEWRTATLEDMASPFFIEDITDKRLRIPPDVTASNHENEVIGADGLTILAADVPRAAQQYAAVLGELPQFVDETAVFDIEGFTITLRAPVDDSERSYQEERSDMPYELVLRTLDHKRVGLLQPGQAHHARILLSGQANLRHARYNPAGGLELE